MLLKIEQIPYTKVKYLVKNITNIYKKVASGINQFVADLDSMSDGADQLPPVMEHALVVLEHSEFCVTVRKHYERLQACCSTSDIYIIEKVHQ